MNPPVKPANYCLTLVVLLLIGAFPASTTAQNPTTYPTDTSFYKEAKKPGELRILSWNIKMLPRLVLRLREGQIPQDQSPDSIDGKGPDRYHRISGVL